MFPGEPIDKGRNAEEWKELESLPLSPASFCQAELEPMLVS